MKKLYLSLIMIIHVIVSFAQGVSVTGEVLDDTGRILPGATVHLLADNKIIRQSATDIAGKFTFSGLTAVNYTITVNSTGFESYRAIINPSTPVYSIRLKAAVNNLKEVAVTYTRPAFEQRAGKTVVNVAGSINAAGSNAFDILQKSPGVTVDDAGTVRLSGKTGVQVMIDGKLQPVAGDDLVQLLKGLPANLIDKIDLNTNPSSKYDAAGNGGIIDIRTKKEQRAGTYGSLTGSLTHAKFLKGTTGLSVNHRAGAWNFALTYNYTNRRDYATLNIERLFYTNEALTGTQRQRNAFQIPVQIHNVQTAVDYFISKTTSIGMTASLYTNDNTRLVDNRTSVFDSRDSYTGFSVTDGESDYHRRNPAVNLNLRQKVGDGGQFSADLDYAFYGTKNNQTTKTGYFTPTETVAKDPYTLFGDLSGQVIIKTAKADYSQPLKGWVSKIDAGWKSSWVTTDNDVAFFDQSKGGNEPVTTISNHFIYDENINAAYLSLHKTSKNLSVVMGLRVENTNTRGEQVIGNANNTRNYTQLFPNLTLDYKVNQNQMLGLSVSRRIDRPTYKQLNPFRYYLTDNTYTVGNPDLKPQITYAAELSHIIADKYSFRYGYARTTDYMLRLLSPDPSAPNVVQQTDRNLAVLNYYSFNFSAPVIINNWWKSANNVLVYYGDYKGTLANTAVKTGAAAWQLNTTNTFALTKTMTAELSAIYHSREVDGFLTTKSNGSISAGLQQQLFNKSASIRLNVSDIFLMSRVNGITRTIGYYEHFLQNNDTRQVTLSLSYRFGKPAKISPKKASGADDEKRRAG